MYWPAPLRTLRYVSRACCVGLALAGWIPEASRAQSTDAEIKSRIVNDVSGKPWQQNTWPRPTYLPGRFFIEASLALPPDYLADGEELIETIAKGDFEIIEPTQQGSTLQDLPGYLDVQPMCASAPIRYWGGIREMSQHDFERRKDHPDALTPYLPGEPRPIDYETQLYGRFGPYAVASANFALYDFGPARTDDKLLLFKGEDYKRTAPKAWSWRDLEGSFAAFEVPSCRFVGTLDYVTRCRSVAGYKDASYVAEVIRVHGRPFVFVSSASMCMDIKNGEFRYELLLWDVTAETSAPLAHQFVYVQRLE